MGSLAKLTRPKLHKVLPRQRLFDQLHDCLERPLTWVSGPPGSGKTSLVASYLSSQRTGGFWYHLDAGDGDLATLFHYLALAVETKGRKAVPLPVLSPQHQDDLTGFARVFFRALFQRIKAPAVLVLDNYHELAVDSPLHGLWETIVRELPTGIAMLVISRTPPPPQCAGLRVLDRLSQLEWESLRLTLDETRSFAAARYAVDEETLRGLHESARGWPVGLVLMLERLRRVDDAGDGADQDREVLFDYFAAQIFATLPEATRLVLMRVALLPRASAAQARSVSGQDCAEEVLDRLYRQRLFVDKRGDAYQLHDLFRAFLLAQLQHSFDSAQVRQWRSAAAELMAIEGQVEDAFALACDAGNWRVAAGVLLLHAASIFEQGRSATLLAWIERLPAEVVEANAWLGFWYAVAAVVRSPALSRTRFKETYPRFEAEGNETAMVLCCGGIVTTYYWEFDNLATLEPWIDRLLALLERSPLFPAKAAELRIYSALLFALSFRRPQPNSLARCIDRIHALLAEDCPANARIDAAALLLAHACNCGDFAQGGRVVALAEPWLSDPDVGPFYRPLWWMQVGHYHGARGDEARAAQAYAEAWTWMERNALTVPLLRVHCQIGLARLALCRGDVEAAESARTATAAYWTAARRIDTCLDTGLRGLIAACRGDAVEALARAREQVRQAGDVGVAPLAHSSRLQLAAALVESGDCAQARETLRETRELLQGGAYAPLSYQVDLLEAWVALRTGEREVAQAALARGLAASRDDEGMLTLRLLPRVLPMLLAEAIAAGIDADHAVRLARRFQLRPPGEDAQGWPWPLEVRTFGRFEIRRDGEPLVYSRKAPKKTLALLKAMLALGAGSVSEQRLMDTLWPDEEGDAAANSLAATVLRLRTLLGDPAAVAQHGGKLSLDRTRVWVDLFAFERALVAADAAAHARDPSERAHLQQALSHYEGAFLASDEAEAWTVAARERLRGRFIHALGRHAERLEADGQFEAAVLAYLRGLDADAAVESFYQGLMRCHEKLGRRGEAIGAYRRMKQILSVTLGLAPSPASERLYQSLRAE